MLPRTLHNVGAHAAESIFTLSLASIATSPVCRVDKTEVPPLWHRRARFGELHKDEEISCILLAQSSGKRMKLLFLVSALLFCFAAVTALLLL